MPTTISIMSNWKSWTDEQRDRANEDVDNFDAIDKRLFGAFARVHDKDEVWQAIRIGRAVKQVRGYEYQRNLLSRLSPERWDRTMLKRQENTELLVPVDPQGEQLNRLVDVDEGRLCKSSISRSEIARMWWAARALTRTQFKYLYRRYSLGLEGADSRPYYCHEGRIIERLRELVTRDMRIDALSERAIKWRRRDFRSLPDRQTRRKEYAAFWWAVHCLPSRTKGELWKACAYAPPEKVWEWLDASPALARRRAKDYLRKMLGLEPYTRKLPVVERYLKTQERRRQDARA